MTFDDFGYEDFDDYGDDYTLYPEGYCSICGGECVEGGSDCE